MEKEIKVAKLSLGAFLFKVCIIDLLAMCILVGFVWIVKDFIKYFNTKLIITNKRISGKTGLVNKNELDSSLNKINSIQVKQGAFGQMLNYGTVIITTASSSYYFDFIDKPNDFKTILNNQIEKYDDERIEKQAKKMAEAMKN